MKGTPLPPKFTPQNCDFDELKDIHEVSQTGSINLKTAYSEGVIPADMDDVDDRFNSIESDSVLGKPTDTFDYERMSSKIKETMAKSSDSSSTEENQS